MVYNISCSAVKILLRKEVGQTMNQDIPRKYVHEKPGQMSKTPLETGTRESFSFRYGYVLQTLSGFAHDFDQGVRFIVLLGVLIFALWRDHVVGFCWASIRDGPALTNRTTG